MSFAARVFELTRAYSHRRDCRCICASRRLHRLRRSAAWRKWRWNDKLHDIACCHSVVPSRVAVRTHRGFTECLSALRGWPTPTPLYQTGTEDLALAQEMPPSDAWMEEPAHIEAACAPDRRPAFAFPLCHSSSTTIAKARI